MKKSLAFFALAVAPIATPVPLLTAPAVAQTKNQICMARTTTGRSGGDKRIIVVVKKASQSSLEARGFKNAACKGTSSQRSEYNHEICKFARIAPAIVQQDFKRTHGASPTELCQAGLALD